MAEYANGDTGSDRAYEYEEERDGVEAENYILFCRTYGFDAEDDNAVVSYRAWCATETEKEMRER